jgi:ATP-dependent Clp protease ATP-binding subunit ClpB
MQLEIEREALKKEEDAASRERLKRIEKEIADLKGEANALQASGRQKKRECKNYAVFASRLNRLRLRSNAPSGPMI